MKLPRLAAWVARRMLATTLKREPDFIIGGGDRPYLLRWWLIPRNPLVNVYLHQFMRSDDDRALHDHPWLSASLMLVNEATEHTIAAGGVHRRRVIRAGDVRLRGARFAHRIELHAGACLTLFITGPRLRAWGFHCAERGWVPWQRFTAPGDKGAIGKGCDA